MKSRLKRVYVESLPKIFAVRFANRYNKEKGIYIFADRKDADYFYKMADKMEFDAWFAGNTTGKISDFMLDKFDYSLIRLNQYIEKTLCKTSSLSTDILDLDGKEYYVEIIGDHAAITYMKD